MELTQEQAQLLVELYLETRERANQFFVCFLTREKPVAQSLKPYKVIRVMGYGEWARLTRKGERVVRSDPICLTELLKRKAGV